MLDDIADTDDADEFAVSKHGKCRTTVARHQAHGALQGIAGRNRDYVWGATSRTSMQALSRHGRHRMDDVAFRYETARWRHRCHDQPAMAPAHAFDRLRFDRLVARIVIDAAPFAIQTCSNAMTRPVSFSQQGPPNERDPTGLAYHFTLSVGTLQVGGRRITDGSLLARTSAKNFRADSPVRMPERSADARLVDGAGPPGPRSGLPMRCQALPSVGSRHWGEPPTTSGTAPPVEARTGLAVPERLDQRQAVSFITRWIEQTPAIADRAPDGRIVGVGKDLERAGDASDARNPS